MVHVIRSFRALAQAVAYPGAHDGAVVFPARPVDGSETVDARFTALYEANVARVYAFVRSQVGSVADAHDLVGRIFYKAFLNWRRAPDGDRAVMWLFTIARTTVIDHWRVEGKRSAVRVSIEEIGEIADAGDDPESQCLARERRVQLLRVIGLLDEDNRMLLGLRFTAQRTNREIAGILGISEAAVSMRLLRALRRLRDELTRLGIS